MARIPRVVIPGLPHHITQRGNNARQVFFDDRDHLLYLRLLKKHAERYHLSLWGYCLMPNHVHLVAVPREPDSLARTLGRTHADYARSANIHAGVTGHFWESRFYSCPMDERHRWFALAYVERNPVRAGLVSSAVDFPWSSAGAHLGGPDLSSLLDTSDWCTTFDPTSWSTILSALSRDEARERRIREATRTGRPLGEESFLDQLEQLQGRLLRPKARGRKPNPPSTATLAQAAS